MMPLFPFRITLGAVLFVACAVTWPVAAQDSVHDGLRKIDPRFDGGSDPARSGPPAVDVLPSDPVLFDDPIADDEAEPAPPGSSEPARPALLEPAELAGLDKLSPARRKLVEAALRIGRERHLGKYIFGSADPTQGGFDCSGAIFHLLKQAGLEPPRTSANQFDWVKRAGLLVEVPAGTSSLDHKVFSKLKPGDLLFWSGTYRPTDGRTNGITHVQMYLGRERKDGRPVMIGSSDGRSYRGTRQCGYGVFDFKLPRNGAKARFAGYGPPPALTANSVN